MNAQQRKFLIDKINSRVTAEIKALESSKPKRPDVRALILSELMKGNVIVKSSEELNELFKKRAFEQIEEGRDSNWLSNESGRGWGSFNETTVKLKVEEIFNLPPNYHTLLEEYNRQCEEIRAKVVELTCQLDTLETRITLASDKVLQTMISEVDNMGDISLINTKIKLLN